MLPGVIKGNALLKESAGWGKFSTNEQSGSQRSVGCDEENRILEMLGEAQKLLSQLPCRFSIRAGKIKLPQPPQDPSELWGLSYLAAEFARPRVDRPYVWSGKAFGRLQRGAEGDVQRKLLLKVRRRVR